MTYEMNRLRRRLQSLPEEVMNGGHCARFIKIVLKRPALNSE